ncbi:MAG: hypothetical protein ACKPGT_21430, partial [Microcystis sp.]
LISCTALKLPIVNFSTKDKNPSHFAFDSVICSRSYFNINRVTFNQIRVIFTMIINLNYQFYP